jgi:hypothetical protein
VNNDGVVGDSINGNGVIGISHNAVSAGIDGRNTNPGGLAGFFDGKVVCNGDLQCNGDILLPSAGDCAEEFESSVAGEIEPGIVMVLDDNGALQPSQQAYDKKVAGVISGAGGYKPGIILGKSATRHNGVPLALVGKVCCWVDAQYAPIEVGDLLTTSPTLGHAMKASDRSQAFGAVIGKALRPLRSGQGLVPILIALQ